MENNTICDFQFFEFRITQLCNPQLIYHFVFLNHRGLFMRSLDIEFPHEYDFADNYTEVSHHLPPRLRFDIH